MSKPNPAELPASMVIIGLLIERPNQTVSDVAHGLDRRFARSRFHPSTAHNALPQMARSGHRRPRVRCTYRAPGGERNQDRYEATSEGVEAFRAWMAAAPSGAPALREALHGRIELCRLTDLPELIRLTREEALIARDLYSSASTKWKQYAEDHAEPDNHGERSDADYLRKVRDVLLCVSPEYWGSRYDHMEAIRRHLESIAAQAGIEFVKPK